MISAILKVISALVLLTCRNAEAAKFTGPINQAGLNLIKEFEGFYANFYMDPVGIKTIGYGHACHVNNCGVPLNGKYSVPLTQSTGESLLKDDLSGFESCVNSAISYSNLNADQFSSLVSFAFNLGCGSLRSSTLRTKLNQGDVRGASEEFGRWVRAGGKVLRGLVRRREAERTLFCRGGVCGGASSGSSPCVGRITATSLNVRSQPNTSGAVVGTVSNGQSVTISERVAGTSVSGNRNWFRISNGYISAVYVTISTSNGQSWCSVS